MRKVSLCHASYLDWGVWCLFTSKGKLPLATDCLRTLEHFVQGTAAEKESWLFTCKGRNTVFLYLGMFGSWPSTGLAVDSPRNNKVYILNGKVTVGTNYYFCFKKEISVLACQPTANTFQSEHRTWLSIFLFAKFLGKQVRDQASLQEETTTSTVLACLLLVALFSFDFNLPLMNFFKKKQCKR